TASYQPQRLGRPVTVPYSRPVLRIFSPTPSGPSLSSVGNGPRPTRVEYAFSTPMIRVRCRAGTPLPLQTPVVELFELVTNGYVPWSTSSRLPCAASNRIRLSWSS